MYLKSNETDAFFEHLEPRHVERTALIETAPASTPPVASAAMSTARNVTFAAALVLGPTTLPQQHTWPAEPVARVVQASWSVDLRPEPIRRLESLASLSDNWDRHGARAPSTRVIAAARDVLRAMMAHALPTPESGPHVAPGSSGEIAIEWRKANRQLHVYCLPEGSFEVLQVDGDDSEESEGGMSLVTTAIRWFVA